jgi:KDO2-lipid IV(A) lauroyltransferase
VGVTQACTRVLEEAVREHPSFWLWMHRRWKTPPP